MTPRATAFKWRWNRLTIESAREELAVEVQARHISGDGAIQGLASPALFELMEMPLRGNSGVNERNQDVTSIESTASSFRFSVERRTSQPSRMSYAFAQSAGKSRI